MAATQNGLSSIDQVEALADQLSACADEIHARVMKAIRAHKGGPIGEREQAVVRALLEDEVMLRQRANGLYADAAAHVVKSLPRSQQHVLELTAAAAEKIRKIALIGDVTGLVAGLLTLAGAVATGQAAGVMKALETIETQAKAIDSHRKKTG